MSIETLKNSNSALNDLAKEVKETLNSVPKMNEDEITQLNESQLYEIFSQSEWKSYHDQNWEYIIVDIKDKKVDIKDKKVNIKDEKRKLYYTRWKKLKDNLPYICTNTIEHDNFNISIWIPNWKEIKWVYAHISKNNSVTDIYKWNLAYKNGDFQPKNKV